MTSSLPMLSLAVLGVAASSRRVCLLLSDLTIRGAASKDRNTFSQERHMPPSGRVLFGQMDEVLASLRPRR